jgi:outer membrane protein
MIKKTFLICCISAFVITQNSFAQTKWNLKQCVDSALARNLNVLEATTSNETKRIDLEQAKYQRYPNLSFLGKETGYHYFSTSDLSNNKENSSVGNYSLNSSVVLYNGGQLQKRIQQHSLDYQSGKLDIEKNKVDMSLSIVNAYLQILYNYEQLDLSKEILTQVNKQYENTEMLVKYGSLPQTNLTQMKAQVASQKFNVTQAESNLYISKVNLMLLMEIPVVDSFDVEKPVLPDSTAVQQNSIIKSQEIYTMALGNQPQVKSAKLKSDLAQLNTDIARTAYFPVLSANANVGSTYNSSSFTKNYQDYSIPNQLRDNMSSSLGLSLSIPIFNNWATKANVMKAEINKQFADLDKAAVELQLRKDIEQSYADFIVATKNYESALENVQANKETYQNAEYKYNLGLITSVDLLTIRNNYVTATSQFIQTKYQYFFKSKVLDFYQGKPLN